MYQRLYKTVAGPLSDLLRIAGLVVFLVVVQEAVINVLDHQAFSNSVICKNQTILEEAGRYAYQHCQEHKQLGDAFKLRTWVFAFYEAHFFALFVAGLVLVFL